MALDIDGTIIGTIDAQLAEYQLVIQGNSKVGTRSNGEKRRGKMFKDQLVTQLVNGIMRPGFSRFCAKCRQLGIPMILYTAAEDEWAQFLVPCIERAVQIEIDRDFPEANVNTNNSSSSSSMNSSSINSTFTKFKFAKLFARKHCLIIDGMTKKSFHHISQEVFHVMKKLYPRSVDMTVEDVLKKTILVDNTAGVLLEPEQMVLVPTYEYAYVYDVTMNIDVADTSRMFRAKSLDYASYLGTSAAAVAKPSEDVTFRSFLYSALAHHLRAHGKHYHDMKKGDRMWSILERGVEKYEASRGKNMDGAEFAGYLSKVMGPMNLKK